MFDNFTDSTKELIYSAQNLAMSEHNTLIEPIHILNAMAKSEIEYFAPEKHGRDSFFCVKNTKKEKNQLGGNKHYGKKILLSLHRRQREDA